MFARLHRYKIADSFLNVVDAGLIVGVWSSPKYFVGGIWIMTLSELVLFLFFGLTLPSHSLPSPGASHTDLFS